MCGSCVQGLDMRGDGLRWRPRWNKYTLRLTNMEVDGMVPWKTTFLYEQGTFHFHVSESECCIKRY